MSSQQSSQFSVDRYVVMHVATTCDEHGVYVTKDSAEVIELGWILLDANTLEEVSFSPWPGRLLLTIDSRLRRSTRWNNKHANRHLLNARLHTRASSLSLSTLPSHLCAVSCSPNRLSIHNPPPLSTKPRVISCFSRLGNIFQSSK